MNGRTVCAHATCQSVSQSRTVSCHVYATRDSREKWLVGGGRDRAETVAMIDLCVPSPITHPPNMSRSLTTTTHSNVHGTQQPDSLGLADGDALVEALLVVEVLEGVEDGALRLACVNQEAMESAA